MITYCKFGNFRENFIFTNSVKRHICDVKICDYDIVYPGIENLIIPNHAILPRTSSNVIM